MPDRESDNLFGFETTFDGEPVDATLHQQVFAFLDRGPAVPEQQNDVGLAHATLAECHVGDLGFLPVE